MTAKVVKLSQAEDLEAVCREAADLLRAGRPVIFPTETVYGVGASAASREAVAELQRVKGRPQDKPFTVHLAEPSEAELYVERVPPVARRLIEKAWPGPLTLILKMSGAFDAAAWRDKAGTILPPVPELVYHNGAVGLRCPADDVARAIIRMSGVPVVASSANRSGQAPPYDADRAMAELGDQVPLIIDGGRTRHEAASTVVEVREDGWSVLREGVLSQRYLQKLATITLLFVCTGNTCRSPMAEALARLELAERFGLAAADVEERRGLQLRSAGVFGGGQGATCEAQAEVARRGGSLAGHRSRSISTEMVREADVIYCMTRAQRQAVLALAPEAAEKTQLLDPGGREIRDPLGADARTYQDCADQIMAAVRKRMEERFP